MSWNPAQSVEIKKASVWPGLIKDTAMMAEEGQAPCKAGATTWPRPAATHVPVCLPAKEYRNGMNSLCAVRSTATPAPVTSVGLGCDDQHVECQEWMRQGRCYKTSSFGKSWGEYMQKYCCSSCTGREKKSTIAHPA